MRALVVGAVTSLAGLAATVVLYSFYPLPSSGTAWTSPGLWLSVGLLAIGLACFVVLVVTGLILVLNWNAAPRRTRRRGP